MAKGVEWRTGANVLSKGFGLGGRPGVLTLENGRLVFTDKRNTRMFDVPAEDAANYKKPWYRWGTGFVFRSAGTKYTVIFNKGAYMHGHSGSALGGAMAVVGAVQELGDISRAREACRGWERNLAKYKTKAG